MAFLPLADDRAAPFLAQLPEGERFKTWHVVCPDGTLRSRGAGGIAVLGYLDLTKPLARLLAALHVTPVVDLLYGVVSRNRGWLGAFVRDRPGPDRFP